MNPGQPQQSKELQKQQQYPQLNQQQQQQNMTGLPNGANGNNAMTGGTNNQTPMGQSMMAGQIPPQLVNLMANPALAAQANLFSNSGSAMLPNAGGFLSMPGNPGQGLMIPNIGAINSSLMGGSIDASQNTMASVSSASTPIAPMAGVNNMMGQNHNSLPLPPIGPTSASTGTASSSKGHNGVELSAQDRARQNRDRNREHARSTRLRKKAYVQKLKELVEGLHAERTEEVRQRRVAIQHLAEMQNVRRNVTRNFLKFMSNNETDDRKWATILEDDFWLKQPVTPYRSFRRAEIEKECRMSRGVEAMICEASSLAVMIEGIGSRSARWMQIKRDEFVQLEEAKRGSKKMPRCVVRQDSKLQHAISSLSSSSGGSSQHGSSGEDTANGKEETRKVHKKTPVNAGDAAAAAVQAERNEAKKVSSSSGSGSSSDGQRKQEAATSNDFHDYHAKPLPDPKLGDSEDSSPLAEDSPEESQEGSDGKRISADSSSGEDSAAAIAGPRPTKRRKHSSGQAIGCGLPGSFRPRSLGSLPPNIAKKGGIPHNIRPAETGIERNGTARLNLAPAIPLPPFVGIGKSSSNGSVLGGPSRSGEAAALNQDFSSSLNASNGPAVISADVETSSSSSASKAPLIRGSFHINEDDMILMETILMCPFIFRSQDAVLCGALADCVMPGMLRAHFTTRNKLASVELVYDAMGFMQQLERASGNEGTAQIIPGSLEMALAPCSTEARVITMACPPYRIVNVNEMWTRTTGYTQMEVEGMEYLTLLEGEGTVQAAKERPGRPSHKLEEVAKGRPACSTNIHYDKDKRDFIEFVCSYPLTNSSDQITHILHISKELPSLHDSLVEQNV